MAPFTYKNLLIYVSLDIPNVLDKAISLTMLNKSCLMYTLFPGCAKQASIVGD